MASFSNPTNSATSFLVLVLSAGACGAAIYYHKYHINTRTSSKHSSKHESLIAAEHPLITGHPSYGDCIYMDYNATTPIYTEVYSAITPYLTVSFGNPSSSHIFGPVCKQAVENARLQIGKLLKATIPSEEIIFTSCGSESDNRAIDIALHHFYNSISSSSSSTRDVAPEVITSAIEHPAVLCYLRTLAMIQKKIILTIIPVDSEGFVILSEIEKALNKNTALVTIMHSNNEVGTVQPIQAISRLICAYNQRENTQILFHTDAAQSIGKLPVDVNFLGVDLMTIVGHKFGAPKGIAALFVKKGIKTPQLLIGGGQERGLRAGTENVAFCVGLGEASQLAEKGLTRMILHLLSLKLRLLQKLSEYLEEHMSKVQFNGPQRSCNPQQLAEDIQVLQPVLQPTTNQLSAASDLLQQLPNTLSVSFKGLIGHKVVSELANTVACSAGSACHSVTDHDQTHLKYELSEVLKAMNVKEEFGLGTIRLSCGKYSTLAQMDSVALQVANAVKKMWTHTSKPI